MKSRTEPPSRSATSPKRAASAAGGSQQKAPLYLKVARELKAEIVSGIYPVGASITTEDELCKRFSVSRHTVREAIRVLRDDGLVASRQGAGTVVIPPRTISADMHQVMSINDLLAFASDARFEIESMKMVTIDSKLAAHTGIPAGEEWLEVLGYRRTESADAPVSRAEYYINRAFAAVGRLIQRHSGPIFPLIEDLFGQRIVEVHQQISATLTSRALANEFKVKESSAALEVRRTYKTADDRIAQVTINTHPASRFQHSMTMRWVKA